MEVSLTTKNKVPRRFSCQITPRLTQQIGSEMVSDHFSSKASIMSSSGNYMNHMASVVLGGGKQPWPEGDTEGLLVSNS